MIAKLAPIYSTAWRAAVVLLSVEIAVVSVLRYFTDLDPPPPPVAANAFANPFLVLHVIGGVAALLVAPVQFVGRVRTRWPAFHRANGCVYLAACAMTSPTGLILALGTTSGPVAAAGFAIPALLLPVFTWWAWRAAVARQFDRHRDWMLRSYAVIATAITLRLMLPASALLGIDFSDAYPVIAWLAWMTNLALFEYLIRRDRVSGRDFTRYAAA